MQTASYKMLWEFFLHWHPDLWAIAISDFRPLETCKNLCPPLPTITFTVNSHSDNHFYKYIYLFQVLCSMKSVFLLRYTLRFFIFQFGLNVKHQSCFFSNKKNMIFRKNYRKQYETIIELYVVHTYQEITGVITSRKNNSKN